MINTRGAESVLYKVLLMLKGSLFWKMSQKKTMKYIRRDEVVLYRSGIDISTKFFFWEISLKKATRHTTTADDALYRSDTNIPLKLYFGSC
jgi:hypothetical protein